MAAHSPTGPEGFELCSSVLHNLCIRLSLPYSVLSLVVFLFYFGFDSFVTAFSLIFISLRFIFIRRKYRHSHSWAVLMVLDDCTFLVFILLTLELYFLLALTRSLSISLHYLISLPGGGGVWCRSSYIIWGRRLWWRAIYQIVELYFCCPHGWQSISFLEEGGFDGVGLNPKDVVRDILISMNLWSDFSP